MAEKPKNNPEPQKNLTPSERKHAVFERSLFLNSVFSAPEQTEGSDPFYKKLLYDQEEPRISDKISTVFGEHWKGALTQTFSLRPGLWVMFDNDAIDQTKAVPFMINLLEIGFELQSEENVDLFYWEIKKWIENQELFDDNFNKKDTHIWEIEQRFMLYIKDATTIWDFYNKQLESDFLYDQKQGVTTPEENVDISAFENTIEELNFDTPMLSSGLEVKLDPSILEFIESLDLSALPDKSDSNPLDDL